MPPDDPADWSFPSVEPAGPADPPAAAGDERATDVPADAARDAAARLGFGGPQVSAWQDESAAAPLAGPELPGYGGGEPELLGDESGAYEAATFEGATYEAATYEGATEDSGHQPGGDGPSSYEDATAGGEPAWAYGTPVPPAPNFDVPRRNPAVGTPVSPLRALAGAMVAVAGVLLGIGALLWATDAPAGDPTVTAAQARTSQVQASPSASVLRTEPSTAAAVVVAPSPRPIAAQSSPAAVTAPEPASPPKLALTVLNNSNRTLLADRAARRFAAAGWPIRLTGNFTGRVSETTVYYEPGQLASAKLLQRSFAGLTRVRPRFESLPGEGLTVVLTRSYDA